MSMSDISFEPAVTARYSFEVRIAAPVRRVWDALTCDVGSWWPAAYHTSDRTRRFIVEGWVGGRVFEDYGDGEGVLWGHVVHVLSPRKIKIQFPLFSDYGGPGAEILAIELVEDELGVKMMVEDSMHGRITPQGVANMREGWIDLFDTMLKQFCEGGQ